MNAFTDHLFNLIPLTFKVVDPYIECSTSF